MNKTKKMVGLAILTAVVVVLTGVATFVKFGSFPITLTLIPIVVGAALYGRNAGAYLGAAFGVMVLIFCISGADPGGFVLWSTNPFITAILCLLKGAAAGFAAGLVYEALGKKNKDIGVIAAAFVCPVVNTGIFIAAMLLLFRDTLSAWAGGSSLFYFAIIGLAGVNFLLELCTNIALCPAALRIIKAVE